MKQTTFEIRQQAENMLKQAIAIWRQSDKNDYLENVENDPVFSLLLTTLAYQLNDIDYDIEDIKSEVLNDYTDMLKPYELMHAVPATAVISTRPQPGVGAVTVDDSYIFRLESSERSFIPLLRTNVLEANVASVVRLDGRRWKVKLNFPTPVTDISYFAFAIENKAFKNVKVTLGNKMLRMVKPWHYDDLPLNDCFSLDASMYNRASTLNATSIWLDLFATHNTRIFCLKKSPACILPEETDHIELVFEFFGLDDGFHFSKNELTLNPIILINAEKHIVNISASTPILRITGYNNGPSEDQFLHMLRPSQDQIFYGTKVDVRTVAGDRFNQARLLKLINNILNKFDTDFYAFIQLKKQYHDTVILQIREGLQQLKKACFETPANNISGTYLVLSQNEAARKGKVELQVVYLTTSGAFINDFLNGGCSFIMPAGLDSSATRLMQQPIPGKNEITDEKQQAAYTRYNLMTGDRIVTPSDIKAFCRAELLSRFSITEGLIDSINVRHQLVESNHGFGYEIWIEIFIQNTPYITKHFTEKIPQAELFLEKLISVRTASIFPLKVNILIGEENNI